MAHFYNNELDFELGYMAPDIGATIVHRKTKKVYELVEKKVIDERCSGELNKPISQEPKFYGARETKLVWKERSTGNIIGGRLWQEEDTTQRGNEAPNAYGYANGVRHLVWTIDGVAKWERKDKWCSNVIFGYTWRDRVIYNAGNLRYTK